MSKRLPVWMEDDAAPTRVEVGAESLPPWMEDAGPGAGRSLVLGFSQGGTLGSGDEISAAILDLADRIQGREGPKAGANASPELREQIAKTPTTGDLLEKRMRSEAAEAAKKHPKAYYGGEIVGGVALPLPGGAGMAKAIGTGAAYGLGKSEADLGEGEYIKALVDTAIGAGAGGLGGVVGERVVAPVARTMASPLARGLERLGLSQGRRVLTNGADSLSSRLPVSDDAVREALESRAIRPGETTEGVLGSLERLTERTGGRYARIIEELERRGISGPRATEVADELLRRAERLEPETMNPALPAELRTQAERVLEKPAPAWASPTMQAQGPRTESLRLSQAESLKRSLQDQARYGRVEETPLNEVRRQAASVLREANEDAITRGAAQSQDPEAQALAREFVPTKRRLGRLIEARDAAERGATRAAQRSSGLLPGKLELAGAAATHNPLLLVGGPTLGFLKARGTSTVASGAHRLAQALRRGAPPAAVDALAARYAGALLPTMEFMPHALRPATAESEDEMRIRALAEALGGVR